MGRKVQSSKKRARNQGDEMVEDLDLDINDTTNVEDYADEDVAHNRRARKASRKDADRDDDDDDDVAGVLPSDAHRLDGYGDDENGGYIEEEELAVATEKGLRRKAMDEDFDVAGISLADVRAEEKKRKKSALDLLESNPVIEAVERDFASLTTKERLAVLKKESPELLKLLDDLKKYLAEVKSLAKPLHELLHERKISKTDKNLVSFLETKVQLMLSYCMHVTFYLLLKSEGKKVAGHPVIDNLVEIRVYLEKMWPLEEKLQYSLNRLLSGKSATAAQVESLRPVKGSESGVYEATRSVQDTEARDRRRQLRAMKEAEELDREEEATMTRMRTKAASALNAVGPVDSIAPVSYQEDEDQFFSRITGDDAEGEEEGLPLMEVLRRRQQRSKEAIEAKKSAKSAAAAPASEEDDGEDYEEDLEGMEDMEDEGDFLGDDEEGDDEDVDYDAMWEEEHTRKARDAEKAAVPREKLVHDEVNRRKAGKKIESHRGLTKARPKDRKNPRVAQRRKYDRGMQVHKSQTRSFRPEPSGGFVGVPSLKTGVVRGTKLQ